MANYNTTTTTLSASDANKMTHEARQKADRILEADIRRKVRKMYTKIQKAAKKGKFSTRVRHYGLHSTTVQCYLNEMAPSMTDYEVTNCGLGFFWVNVSWKD